MALIIQTFLRLAVVMLPREKPSAQFHAHRRCANVFGNFPLSRVFSDIFFKITLIKTAKLFISLMALAGVRTASIRDLLLGQHKDFHVS